MLDCLRQVQDVIVERASWCYQMLYLLLFGILQARPGNEHRKQGGNEGRSISLSTND